MVTPKEALKKYGPAEKEAAMQLWDIPADINAKILALPNRVYCNRDIVGPLEKAFRNIIARGLSAQIKTWDGCFNLRKMRGLTSTSLHSWGIAVDINAAWNQLNKKPTMSRELVSCFKDAGFDWGGDWARLDGMHFQLAKI